MRQRMQRASAWLNARIPPVVMLLVLASYLVLCVGLTLVMPILPILGLIGALVINLAALCMRRTEFSLPLYVFTAGPSVAFPLATSGPLSRFFIGHIVFVLVTVVWLLRIKLGERKAGVRVVPLYLAAPLLLMIGIGFLSIVYSRLNPDPHVSYSFPHSNVSLTLVNLSEMFLLICLPLVLAIVPGLVRSKRAALWVLGTFIGVGALYALGTIFAAPLGLYSKEVILGVRRPEVFGSVSSGLGTTILMFTTLAFGQALYAAKSSTRAFWYIVSAIFGLGVIMTFGRESWIALLLAILVMVALRVRSWAVLLILFVPLLLLFIPGVADFFNPSKAYGSDRLKIWLDAIHIWQTSPIMGVGAGNYQFFDLVYGSDVVGVAHNQYLQMLAETGVQGLLALLLIIGAAGVIALRRFRAAMTGLGKAISLAYLGFYVCLVFGGLFTATFYPSAASGGGTQPFLEASYRWLFLGLVLSLPFWDRPDDRTQLQWEPAAIVRPSAETATAERIVRSVARSSS